MLCFKNYIIRSCVNVWSEIHTFIGFVNWYRDLLNMVATNYFEMAWCFEILIRSWIWALCLLQLAFWCYMLSLIFYKHGNDWEDLLNYFEAVLPYTTIEKWPFLSVNKIYNSMEDWCVDQNLFSTLKSLIKAWVYDVSLVSGGWIFTTKMTTLLLHEDMWHIQFGEVAFDILCAYWLFTHSQLSKV